MSTPRRYVSRREVQDMSRPEAEALRATVEQQLRTVSEPERRRGLNVLFLEADRRLAVLERERPVDVRVQDARDFLSSRPDAETQAKINAAHDFLKGGPTEDVEERVEEARAHLYGREDEDVRRRARAVAASLYGEREAARRFGGDDA